MEIVYDGGLSVLYPFEIDDKLGAAVILESVEEEETTVEALSVHCRYLKSRLRFERNNFIRITATSSVSSSPCDEHRSISFPSRIFFMRFATCETCAYIDEANCSCLAFRANDCSKWTLFSIVRFRSVGVSRKGPFSV